MRHFKKYVLILIALFILLSSPVYAYDGGGNNKNNLFEDGITDETPSQDVGTGTDSINIFGLMIQIILALAFVGVLIYLLIKFLSLKNRFVSANQPIKLIGTMAFTPQKSVRVVEVGNSLYVIGVGENITMLQKIDDQDEIDLIKATVENRQGSNFSQILRTKMSDMMSKRQNFDFYDENDEDKDRNDGRHL